MIACFLSNICAKYYKNPSMLSRVIAKNVENVFFLRHSVDNLKKFSLGTVFFQLIVKVNQFNNFKLLTDIINKR